MVAISSDIMLKWHAAVFQFASPYKGGDLSFNCFLIDQQLLGMV